jgi:hypothetical protein
LASWLSKCSRRSRARTRRHPEGPPRTRLHAAYRFHARLPPVAVASLGSGTDGRTLRYRAVHVIIRGLGRGALPQALRALVCMPHEGGALTSRAVSQSCAVELSLALTDALVPRCALADLLPSRRSAPGKVSISSSQTIVALPTPRVDSSTSACVVVACPQHLEIPRLGAERKAALLSPRLYRRE